MNILQTRSAIIDRLQQAAASSMIDSEMIMELEQIREGANPRDIIGLRWSDLMLGRYDQMPMNQLVDFFNELA